MNLDEELQPLYDWEQRLRSRSPQQRLPQDHPQWAFPSSETDREFQEALDRLCEQLSTARFVVRALCITNALTATAAVIAFFWS